MIQWIPLNVPPDEFRTILRTFFRVFSHGYVWLAPPHSAFVVGTDRPLELDSEGIRRVLSSPATERLRSYGVAGVAEFVAGLAADRPSLERWLAGEATVNTLEHPVLEFYSPSAFAVPPARRADRNLFGVIRDRQTSLASLSLGRSPPPAVRTGQEVLGSLAEVYRLLDGDEPETVEPALGLLAEAVRRAPSHRLLRYGAILAYRQALALSPRSNAALCGLGHALLMLGQPDQAKSRFDQALALRPRDPEALAGMALVLATHPDPNQRSPREAVRLASQAAAITHRSDPSILAVLVDAHTSAGSLDLARATLREAIALAESLGEDAELQALMRRARLLGLPQTSARPTESSPLR